MQPILRDIRGVAGVTGVAVITKRDGRIERLFPAAFTEQHTAELTKLITSAYHRLRGFQRLSLRFQRVVIYLFNQPDYLLFASVLPHCEEEAFEAIVRSKLPAIERVLARQSNKAPVTTMSTRTTPEEEEESSRVIEILMGACTALIHVLGGEINRTKIAAAWRDARDQAAVANEEMTALEVDAGGKLSVRRGRTLMATAANMQSIVGMIHAFANALGAAGTDAEEAIYSLLEPHRSLLEKFGFYMFLGEAPNGTPGSSLPNGTAAQR